MGAVATPRWDAIRAGRGDLPPELAGLYWVPDLLAANTSIVSGGVQQLGDRSGYNILFTAPAARPTYTASDASYGNRPSMTFNGTTMYLTLPGGLPPLGVVTIYAILQGITGGAGFGRVLVAGTFITHAGATGIILEGFNTAPAFSYRNPAALNSERSVTVTAANITRLCGVGNLAAGGALWTTYKDGVAGGTDIGALATAGNTMSTQSASIGATSAGGSFAGFTCPRIPFLLYGVQHTAAQVARVDAWLQWVNGIP